MHELTVGWVHTRDGAPLLAQPSLPAPREQRALSDTPGEPNTLPPRTKPNEAVQGPTVPWQKFEWLLWSRMLLWTAQAICTARRRSEEMC